MEQVAAALAAIANGGEPFLLPDQPDIDVPDEMPRHDFDRRGARGRKGPGRKGAQRAEPDMETFRIEVGRAHGARHGAIVGAIANEAGIAGKYIGRIRIFDDHSIVDLPTGLPGDVFNVLRDVRVRRRPLRISKLKTSAGPRRR